MMRIQTGEHYLNASDILQVNATILAGVLIFVTIASAASAKTSTPFLGIPIADVYYFVTFAAAIPFVLSSMQVVIYNNVDEGAELMGHSFIVLIIAFAILFSFTLLASLIPEKSTSGTCNAETITYVSPEKNIPQQITVCVPPILDNKS